MPLHSPRFYIAFRHCSRFYKLVEFRVPVITGIILINYIVQFRPLTAAQNVHFKMTKFLKLFTFNNKTTFQRKNFVIYFKNVLKLYLPDSLGGDWAKEIQTKINFNSFILYLFFFICCSQAFTQNSQNSLDSKPIVVAPASDHRKKQAENLPMSNEIDPTAVMSLFNVAAANNVSVEQLAMALRHQQKQHLPAVPFYLDTTTTPLPPPSPPSTTTTTTTTTTVMPDYPEEPPVTKKIAIKPYKTKYATGQKVMNAPKEYYPVGYDKNFDDHFTSKVDLPDTSFSCGDQKHFPGLYGDEDLGCMVSYAIKVLTSILFHVSSNSR